MFKQSAKVKDFSPASADSCAVARPVEGVSASCAFQPFQKRAERAGNGDCVGTGRSTLGLWKGNGAGKKIDQSQIQPGLPETAAGGVGNFKACLHPFLGGVVLCASSQKPSDFLNLFVRKDRPLGHGAFFGAVVEHGHSADESQQTPLAVDPFQRLHVVDRHVAADRLSVGARDGQAPANVLIRMDGGELLQAQAALVQKAGQMAPGVNVVPPSGGADGVAFDHAKHAAVVGFDRSLTEGELRGQLLGLGSVQGVVLAKAGGSCPPFPGHRLQADPVPRTVFSSVNCSHVTSVSNHLKTQTNKG